MYKRTRWHLVGIILLIALCIWGITAVGEYRLKNRKSYFPLGIDLQGGTELFYSLDLSRIDRDHAKVANEVKDVIANRLNKYGLKEISISVQGQDQLVIQLPGTDSQSVDELKYQIQQAGNLDFRLVAPNTYSNPESQKQFEDEERVFIEAEKAWVAKKLADPNFGEERPKPPDYLVRTEMEYAEVEAGTGRYEFRPKKTPDGQIARHVLVNLPVYNPSTKAWDFPEMVSGRFLHQVNPTIDNKTLKPAVEFEFKGEGASAFAELTQKHKGELLAIVLDDDVMEIATIRDQIIGRGILSGNFTDDLVRGIVSILRGGSLPTRPKLISESTVGSVLGQDSIESGIRAMLVGICCVMAIMTIYYMVGGVVANFALALNLLLILAFVMIFNQTLTLPGIAGVLLTLAMAVDANILIFERYREERNRGKNLVQSLSAGYDRAFWVIFDSNLTTIITGYVLFYMGSGPVKGFAITLVTGLFASFFTSVFVTRIILSALVNKGIVKEFKMLEAFRTPRIPFTRYQRPLMLGSAIVIAVTWCLVIWRGTENYGIDFTGGARVSMTLREPIQVESFRKKIGELEKLHPNLFRDYSIQTLGADEKGAARKFALLTRAGVSGRKQAGAQEQKSSEAPTLPVTQPTPAPGQPASETSPPASSPPELVAVSAAGLAAEEKEEAQIVREALEAMLARENLLLPPAFPSSNWTTAAGGEALTVDVNLVNLKPDVTDEKLRTSMNAYFENLSLFTTLNRDPTVPYKGISIESVQFVGRALDEDRTKVTRYQVKTTAYLVPLPGQRGQQIPQKTQVEDAVRDYFRQRGATEGFEISEPFPQVLTVGPKVASGLQADAIVAVFISIVGIIFYLALRFEFIYGLAGVIALVHDCMIAIGVMALVDQFLPTTFPVKLNLNELAAILTIIGFSINDTIVLFDRIRENLVVLGKKKLTLADVVDISVNQTLARTLWTSVTVMLVDVILLGFGGESVRGFAFIFAVGTVAGVYSSVFIAAPVAIWLHDRSIARKALLVAQGG